MTFYGKILAYLEINELRRVELHYSVQHSLKSSELVVLPQLKKKTEEFSVEDPSKVLFIRKDQIKEAEPELNKAINMITLISLLGFFDGTFKIAPMGYTQILVLMVLNPKTNIFSLFILQPHQNVMTVIYGLPWD